MYIFYGLCHFEQRTFDDSIIASIDNGRTDDFTNRHFRSFADNCSIGNRVENGYTQLIIGKTGITMMAASIIVYTFFIVRYFL